MSGRRQQGERGTASLDVVVVQEAPDLWRYLRGQDPVGWVMAIHRVPAVPDPCDGRGRGYVDLPRHAAEWWAGCLSGVCDSVAEAHRAVRCELARWRPDRQRMTPWCAVIVVDIEPWTGEGESWRRMALCHDGLDCVAQTWPVLGGTYWRVSRAGGWEWERDGIACDAAAARSAADAALRAFGYCPDKVGT